MSHIFISYSRKDLAIAEKIIDALAKGDLEPWIDWKSIPKGETFEKEIQQGIEKAEIFLFLISPDSVQSEWCNREIEHAAKNGKRILPIVIRDTDPKIVHPEISKRNWIFCRDGQDDFNIAIEETRKTIHTDYEWLKYHTELQVKALKWEQKKDTSRLLRGKELREGEQQLAEVGTQKDPQPTKIQREYILASQRNEIRTRQKITMGLVAGLAVMVLLSFIAWGQRNSAINAQNTAIAESNAKATALVNEENARATAQAEKVRAEKQANIALARQLASQSQLMIGKKDFKQEAAGLLAILSMEIFPSVTAAQILENNLFANPLNRVSHEGTVWAVAFSPDGKYIATGGEDGTVRVWKAVLADNLWFTASTKELARMTHKESITSVAFSKDGIYIVSGSRDNTARVWEVASGKEVAHMTHGEDVNSVAFNPNGQSIVSGSDDNTVRVWETFTGKEIARMVHDDSVTCVAISPDGTYIASGSRDNTARVWESSSGKEISRLIYDDDVWSIVFSPNTNIDGIWKVASSSLDGTARVWDSITGREIARMTHGDRVWSVAFNPDGKFVVSGSDDHTVRIWDSATGSEVTRMTHDGFVSSVAFSPDGKYVASGSYEFSWCNDCFMDNTVRVWEAATGKEIVRISHNNWVLSVAFSPDGKYVVSGSKDNTAQVLLYHPEDMITNACSRVTRNLTHAEWNQYIGDALPYQKVCPNLPIETEVLMTPTP